MYVMQYLNLVLNYLKNLFMDTENCDRPIIVLNRELNSTRIIADIVKHSQLDQSFYVCNVCDIIKKYQIWQKSMPRVKPFYAVKCNTNLTVLKVLAALGTGFDCSTKSEIELVLSLGVDSTRIIYAHTVKSPSFIKYASNVGVKTMTFDDETELHKIKELCPDAQLVIRIKYDARKATSVMGTKFGCPVNETPHLLRIAQKLDLTVIGVSFHVGLLCGDPDAFEGAIAASRYVFDVAATFGYQFKLLDIGGGFPGAHNTNIDEFADAVNWALEEYFPDTTVQVISEPGTFFVCSAFTLACNIITVKSGGHENAVSDVHHSYYLTDGGKFGSFYYFFNVNLPVTFHTLKKLQQQKRYLSILFGSTCTSVDKLADNILLPKYEAGDWLVFKDMGAYAQAVCSSFNGIPFPLVFYVVDVNGWLLLKDTLPLTKEGFVTETLPATSEENINTEESGSVTFHIKHN